MKERYQQLAEQAQREHKRTKDFFEKKGINILKLDDVAYNAMLCDFRHDLSLVFLAVKKNLTMYADELFDFWSLLKKCKEGISC